MSLQIIKFLVKSCRKEIFKFELILFSKVFLLVLSVGAKRRPRNIMWLGELKCLEMFLSGLFSCRSSRWDSFLTLRMCSPDLLFLRREVSPTYKMSHRVHEMQ